MKVRIADNSDTTARWVRFGGQSDTSAIPVRVVESWDSSGEWVRKADIGDTRATLVRKAESWETSADYSPWPDWARASYGYYGNGSTTVTSKSERELTDGEYIGLLIANAVMVVVGAIFVFNILGALIQLYAINGGTPPSDSKQGYLDRFLIMSAITGVILIITAIIRSIIKTPGE